MRNDDLTGEYIRPEFENSAMEDAVVGDIERRLTLWERVTNMDPVRKFDGLKCLYFRR